MDMDRLTALAKARDFVALGLTDTANMFGAMAFSLALQKEGIKPILGALLPVFFEDAGGTSVPKSFLIPLYVQNETGYHNLSKLITLTTVDQRDDWVGGVHVSQLKGYADGLIAFSGGGRGAVPGLFEQGNQAVEDHLKALSDLFPERFYVEIERTPTRAKSEDLLVDLALKHNWPLVATNEAFFADEADYAAHDALLCIKEGTYVSEDNRRRETPHHRLKTAEEMAELFADLPEALANTVHVAIRCSFLLRERKPVLPPYPVKKGETQKDVLRNLAEAGLAARLKTSVKDGQTAAVKKHYKDRLTLELGVIHTMGFDGYFLIVADFIQWAKGQGIAVGPGRGSGAGSLVAWSLAITDVDPIHFKLIFERFLNPERVSMPDFDIDFCPERREEVIQYVQRKYGADSVAHIITFGKLQARAVLRDVGRVLGMPYGQVDKLAKRIPFNPAQPVTLKEVLASDEELRTMCQDDPTVGQLFDYAGRLEGLYRHASTHAAGVVIGDQPLTRMLPLYKDPKSALPATGFNMHFVEKAGLVKFDFLGLKTLTVLQDSVALANARGANITLDQISLDDPKTFELLRAVKVVGLFQFESLGMRDVLFQLQPESFEEIIALGALYRPGPMDDIPHYLACRHGREKVVYPYPCLEGILKKTFGVMVYQEQVLQIAQKLAGYSLGQADLLRRAMGKKIKSEMDAQRKTFIEGVLKNEGGEAEKASALFDQIAKFAGYAFARAHATPYALVSYQTAYMKANHPVAFMTASMNEDIHNTDRLAIFVQDIKNLGLTLLPPDINASKARFTIEELGDGQLAIRYGLAALKNVGEGAMDGLVAERERAGPFKCMFDVFERLNPLKVLNKRQLENLVAAGAMDALSAPRARWLHNLETLLKFGTATRGPMLFDATETRPDFEDGPDKSRAEWLRLSYDAVGFYLNEHPLTPFAPFLKGVTPSDQLEARLEKASFVWTTGVLLSSKVKLGKSGRRFAFVSFSDEVGTFEAIVFEDLLLQVREKLVEGTLFKLKITGRGEPGSMRLLVEEIVEEENLFAHTPLCHVHIKSERDAERLGSLLKDAPLGSTKITLVCAGQKVLDKTYDIHLRYTKRVRLTPQVVDQIVADNMALSMPEDEEMPPQGEMYGS